MIKKIIKNFFNLYELSDLTTMGNCGCCGKVIHEVLPKDWPYGICKECLK